MKRIFLILCAYLFLLPSSFAAPVLVEDIFSDISADYPYRHELQELYDRGMILPNPSGKFSPDAYLNRDEFVGISMEVICERCIQPHTETDFIEKYSDKEIYFDIDTSNPYFYCVAEADARNYVRGYDIAHTCEDGTNMFGERPFCPLNRINLEEAVAVLLRNSGIFTIEDNQNTVDQIRSGNITKTLGSDVTPTDADGNPYTFYGYLQKALSFQITEYDAQGKAKIFKLLELDATGKVNPKKYVTKEEFLKMSYIALKSNSCSEVQENNLALAIDIWEKSCTAGDTDCEVSKLDDPEDTYDFTPDVEGFCEEGIDDPNGYTWRFYNTTTGDEFFHYGTFLDNIHLNSNGEWRVYLTVKDRCGNTGRVYSTVIVGPEKIVDQYIDVDIDVFDDPCTGPTAGCKEIEFEDEEDDGDDIFDFDGDVSTSCTIGTIKYKWTFTSPENKKYYFDTEFVDNFDFLTAGVWNILLEGEDGCKQTAFESMTYTVVPKDVPADTPYIDVDIDVFDDPCTGPTAGCKEIEFEDEEDDGDDIFDFDGDVSTSCTIDTIKYKWTFTSPENKKYYFDTEFVDNFDFLTAGVWNILLEVEDGCKQTGSERMAYVVVRGTTIGLSVDILADPIQGYRDLKVDFQGLVFGGTAPYSYQWDFGDAQTEIGKNIDHLFQSVEVFEVSLVVTDVNRLQGSATVLIKVLDADVCLQDSDGDGIKDCDDICPLVRGTLENKGCPIHETRCKADCSCEEGYSCSDSDPLTCGSGICLPDFDPKNSCLYNGQDGNIFGSSVCLSCPCSNSLDFLADMRKCDLIFPAITSPDAKQIYSRGKIWQVQ